MEFKICEVTAKGHSLLNKVLAGTQLRFTAVRCGNGDFSGDVWDVEDLINYRINGKFVGITPNPRERHTVLKLCFTNELVREHFMLKEVGIYAFDPDEGEIIFAYAYAGERANFIEAYNGKWLTEDEITLRVYTASVADIAADIVMTSYANEIAYDHGKSMLKAENVQDAIDEIDQTVDDLSDKFYRQAMTGNVQNYIDWAKEYPHIGHVRVQPLWYGSNSVRVLVADETGMPASNELTDCFQFYLDPNSSGLGNGVAPIGAHVTVIAGVGKMFNINASIQLTNGYTNPEGIYSAVQYYLAHDASINGCINRDEMLMELRNVPCVAGVLELRLNGDTQNIYLTDNEIPIIDNLVLEVV